MMKKRILLLTAVILLVVAVPPALMASHCFRCKPGPYPGASTCTNATGTLIGGYEDCIQEGDVCRTLGNACAPHSASLTTPLASEYSVASVERIDEPQTVASDNLVAASALPSTR